MRYIQLDKPTGLLGGSSFVTAFRSLSTHTQTEKGDFPVQTLNVKSERPDLSQYHLAQAGSEPLHLPKAALPRLVLESLKMPTSENVVPLFASLFSAFT